MTDHPQFNISQVRIKVPPEKYSPHSLFFDKKFSLILVFLKFPCSLRELLSAVESIHYFLLWPFLIFLIIFPLSLLSFLRVSLSPFFQKLHLEARIAFDKQAEYNTKQDLFILNLKIFLGHFWSAGTKNGDLKRLEISEARFWQRAKEII